MRLGFHLLPACGFVIVSACVGVPPPPPAGQTSGLGGDVSDAGSEAPSSTAVDDAATTDSLDSSTGTTQGLDHASTGTSTTTAEPGSTTGSEDEPAITISDGVVYDFGFVTIGGLASHLFTITNEGMGTATGIMGQPLVEPFAYGALGTCGQELAAADSCLVEVLFSPTELGNFGGSLAIAYDGHADAVRDISGGGSGVTGNLLTNPGGEDTGSPPPGWVASLGSWVASPIPAETDPYEGASLILAETGPNNSDLTLLQDVSVAAWSTVIDEGLLRISVEGQARALASNNDQHRLRTIYLDAGGSALQLWTTDYQSATEWTAYADLRTAPAGTRTIRVELACRKAAGTYCNAYFDALDLHALYP